MNYYETGHAKNVANFEELVNILTGYGVPYNPSKNAIKLPALNTLVGNVKTSMFAVNTALATYKTAVNAREVAFEPLSRLATRILNAIIATDTTEQVDDSAKSYVKKIQGRRTTAKLTEEQKQQLVADGKPVNEVSTSQMSYDNRLDNFDKLIKLVAAIPQYVPNEIDLKLVALNTLYADLKAKNLSVISAHTNLTNARIARNDLLYKALSGLVDLAFDIKTYIKSIFGTQSPQFKQVSGIKFTSIA